MSCNECEACCPKCCNGCAQMARLALDDTQPIDLSTYPPYVAEYQQMRLPGDDS